MSKRQSFFIGDPVREFQASKIAAFEANEIAIKLQKIILPAIGELQNGLDSNAGALLKVVAEKLDDKIMTDIVLPTFVLAQVACVSDNCKIVSKQDINKVFVDADGLADMYELIFEVLKFEYQPFFTRLMGRFGNKDGSQKAMESTTKE